MQAPIMRPLPPTPLKRSQTLESVSSVDSQRTIGEASTGQPQVIRTLPKVDVEIKFNGEKLTEGNVSSASDLQFLLCYSVELILSEPFSG